MLLKEAREQYMKYRLDAGFAKMTVKNDAQAIGRLQRHLASEKFDVRQITPIHMDNFFGSMAQGRYTPGTINTTQAALSAFFRWCRQRGIIKPECDPIAGRRYRPDPIRPMIRIPMAQFPVLLDSAANPRDRMMMACGLYLLARSSEITNIRISDVDLDSDEIHVIITKTHTADRMPISSELRKELHRWFAFYQEDAGPLKPHYFLVPAAKKAYGTTFHLNPTSPISRTNDVMHRALDKIGITDGRRGMHILRRSSARAIFDELCLRGYDGALRRVSAWLHHSSTTITEHYLGLDVDRAQRDKESKGQTLFPSLAADNVIQLNGRGAASEGNVVGM